MGTAGQIFLHALAAASTSRQVTFEDLESRIDEIVNRLHTAAANHWQPVVLELAIFARHLGLSVAASPESGPPEVILDRLHSTDLYLACAAGRGVPGASERLVRDFLGPIAAAVEPIEASSAFIDDVRQALHERLLLANDGPARILQYAGRASLASWIGLAAQRQALGMMRADQAHQRAADRNAAQPALELDPELEYLKTRYSAAFKDAVTVAITRLPARHRTVLRLQTVGGLTLQRIATLLSVDVSTVSRWVQKARDCILDEAQRELGERLGIKVTEVPSIAKLMTSQLDVSVARLLSDADLDTPIKDSE